MGAWVESDNNGSWRRKRERSADGALTEAEAAERMLALVREHDAEQTLLEQDAEERRRRGVTFRELAGDYLAWLEEIKGAKPSTLRDYRCQLQSPVRLTAAAVAHHRVWSGRHSVTARRARSLRAKSKTCCARSPARVWRPGR